MSSSTNYSSLLKRAKEIKVRSIVGIALFCTLLLIPIALILALIDGVIILSTDWANQELKNDATVWGLLSILVIANIGSLIFANRAINIYEALA